MGDWDDDTDYHRAVGCTWGMVAITAGCSLAVLGLIVAATLGLGFFLDIAEALGQ
ncbi:hypothetical protein [Streptomyces sp. NPDC055189]